MADPALGQLLLPSPTEQYDVDALAPFTDTLFYDWDLGIFLEGGESYEQYVWRSGIYGSGGGGGGGGSGREGAGVGAGAELCGSPGGEIGSDFFAALSPPAEDRDQLSEVLGYDFLSATTAAAGTSTVTTTTTSNREGDIQHPPSAPYLEPAAAAAVVPTTTTTTTTMPSPSTYTYASSSSASPPPPILAPTSQQLSENDAHILSIQEAARAAAEEDKRRRNTAASARFRIKKKQRDQAIEKAAKEMAERVENLEKKIATLELENRWLRNLLVEKNNAKMETERRGV